MDNLMTLATTATALPVNSRVVAGDPAVEGAVPPEPALSFSELMSPAHTAALGSEVSNVLSEGKPSIATEPGAELTELPSELLLATEPRPAAEPSLTAAPPLVEQVPAGLTKLPDGKDLPPTGNTAPAIAVAAQISLRSSRTLPAAAPLVELPTPAASRGAKPLPPPPVVATGSSSDPAIAAVQLPAGMQRSTPTLLGQQSLTSANAESFAAEATPPATAAQPESARGTAQHQLVDPALNQHTSSAADPATRLAGHNPNPVSSSATGSNPLLNVYTRAGEPGWEAEIGNRLQWMSAGNIKRADLILHPAELGQVEVKITTDGDKIHVSFVSSNGAAREALEQALPKLRELLADSGLTLGDASVAEQASQETAQQDREDAAEADTRLASTEAAAGEESVIARGSTLNGNALVDTYI